MHTKHLFSRRSLMACLSAALGAIAVGGLLNACGGSGTDAATADTNIQAAWVEIGDGNQAVARVITTYSPPNASAASDANCPQLSVDGDARRMTLRVGPGTMPLRTTASGPADSKPSDFPISVCEAAIPAGARVAGIGTRLLPLPIAQPQRIAVIADTGCRMKKADNAWQACSDATAWPFAAVAATAASMNPDLVLHVGDYHYRENACPPDIAGCQGSPWGYGWDTWQADLFTPAAPLLAKAPWIVVRGNHEECARGGQGWYRFLDTKPYSATRSCNDPANDTTANYSDPYAVALGSDSQVVVFDSAKAGKAALATTDPQFITYQSQFQAVARLAAKTGVTTTMFTNHHPILAFAPVAGSAPAPGNAALQSVMNAVNGQAYYPPGVNLALHGHVHDFQAINFASNHPATIVAGNAGDTLDVALPDPLPSGAAPAPGTTIDKITHGANFGFLMMERRAAPATGWMIKAYTVAGKLLATCTQTGNAIACDKTGFLAP